MKLHFGYLIALSAIIIAGCSAFFSVYGISQLFSGAFYAVIVMASALEFGKIIGASYLQRYWNRGSKILRIYMTIGIVVLIVITSAGIYGFLSNAYQKTSDKLVILNKQVNVINIKKDRLNDELKSFIIEKNGLNKNINNLSKGLSNNVIQYKDKESGKILTTTSSNNRKAYLTQIKDSKHQRDLISNKIVSLGDSIDKLDFRILDLNSNNTASADLGPLKYLSSLTGLSMDRVVNYFILLLIFVFDPLAISLILAANWVFKYEANKNTSDYKILTKTIDNEPVPNNKLKYASDDYSRLISENKDKKVDNGKKSKITSEDIKINTEESKIEPKIEPKIESIGLTKSIKDNTIPKQNNDIKERIEPTKLTPIIPNGKIEISDIKNSTKNKRNFSRIIPRRNA